MCAIAFTCLCLRVEAIANTLTPFASVCIFAFLTAFLEGLALVTESIFSQEVALFAGLAFVVRTCIASIFSRTRYACLFYFIISICKLPESVAGGALKANIIVPAVEA